MTPTSRPLARIVSQATRTRILVPRQRPFHTTLRTREDSAAEKVKGGKSLAKTLEGDPNFLDLVPNMLSIAGSWRCNSSAWQEAFAWPFQGFGICRVVATNVTLLDWPSNRIPSSNRSQEMSFRVYI